jgi:hypothetical protein
MILEHVDTFPLSWYKFKNSTLDESPDRLDVGAPFNSSGKTSRNAVLVAEALLGTPVAVAVRSKA